MGREEGATYETEQRGPWCEHERGKEGGDDLGGPRAPGELFLGTDGLGEDPKVGGLYDWNLSQCPLCSGSRTDRFVASSIHCATLSLRSTHIENENELRLIYSIDPPPGSASPEPNNLVTGANVTFYSKHIAAGLYGCHSRREQTIFLDLCGLCWYAPAYCKARGPN